MHPSLPLPTTKLEQQQPQAYSTRGGLNTTTIKHVDVIVIIFTQINLNHS